MYSMLFETHQLELGTFGSAVISGVAVILRAIKIFTNLGMLFSTLGIALGSWWAYRELGWGGFWFF